MKTIRLTESDLRRLVDSSVREILKEGLSHREDVWGLLSELIECLGAETVCERLVGRMDEMTAYKTLQDIYSVECGDMDEME